MCMLSQRLQVLLDAEQRSRLEQEAEARGTSVAALVREAIDVAFPSTSAARAAAARQILDAPPMEVPDPEELAAELDALRAHPR
jgi:hypothetical protein